MKILDLYDAYCQLAKALRKHIVVAGPFDMNFDQPNRLEQILVAVPWLDKERDIKVISSGRAIVICDSEREAVATFNAVYGDDNSNRNESRPGVEATRVYAFLINRKGEIETENT